MNEPQVWTLIGVFATGLFGMITLMSTMFVRIIKTEIGGLRNEVSAEIGRLRGQVSGEIGGLRNEVSAEIGGLRGQVSGEIGGLRGEVRSIHDRLDRLDRDINALMKHTFGIDRD